ncbi:MAG: hypothetical protein JO034_13025 [Singulisphaera sp.]|nr:hypothetical protein [Singulisphaera sp.]
MTTSGPVVIECSPSRAAAIRDQLALWPEDPASDVRIADGHDNPLRQEK